MRLLVVAVVCVSATLLSACGGASSGEGSTATAKHETTSVTDSAKPPKVALPPGPSPRRLIVRDLRPGTGDAIPVKGGVRIKTNFVALSYRTGKPFEVRWKPSGGFNIGFGPGIEIEGWEKGLVGMRVGGRRELRVPSRLAYGSGAILYVVDLLGIERPPFG